METKLENKRIVLVEDDKLISQALQDYFSPHNQLQTFMSAELFLEAEESDISSTDVFILDYKLPGIDGAQLYRQLKSKYSSSKYICISGEMNMELATQVQKLGFDALILKPFDFVILEKNICNLLSTES